MKKIALVLGTVFRPGSLVGLNLIETNTLIVLSLLVVRLCVFIAQGT